MKTYTGTEAAAYLGIKPSTWRSYVSTGRAPTPDGHIDGRTPYWNQGTLDAYQANRPGQGHRSDLPDEHERIDPAIAGIVAWIADTIGQDEDTPRHRYARLADRLQRGDRPLANLGMEITAWAARHSDRQTTTALTQLPWTTMGWRQAGDLLFRVTAEAAKSDAISEAVADKSAGEDLNDASWEDAEVNDEGFA
jgi:hypothetical protein